MMGGYTNGLSEFVSMLEPGTVNYRLFEFTFPQPRLGMRGGRPHIRDRDIGM